MTHPLVNKTKISQFNRIVSKFRYGLVLQVIRNQLAKIGIEITPFYWVQEGINYLEEPKIEGLASEYKVEFLNAADMKMVVDNARGYTEKDLLSRLDEGKLCLGLKHFDNVVAFFWINMQECDFKPTIIPMEKEEVYLKDMYIIEPYRGKNLAAYFRYQSYGILKKMGRVKIFSVVEYFNTSATKFKLKLNPKKIKFVIFIGIFNKLKWCYTIKTY